jgi:hypothetical protein
LQSFDQALTHEIDQLLDAKIARAAPVTLDRLAKRSFAIRLRDGLARLLKPYL